MMLQALYQLAHDEGLMADPDYEPKPVAWLVRVGEGGELLNIEDQHYTPPVEGRKKPKPVAKPFMIPRQPLGRAGTKAPAAFLVDNAKYVFGLTTPDKVFPPNEGREKSSWFRKLVADCAQATQDSAVMAVLALLDGVANGTVKVALPKETKSNDLFAFVYAPDITLMVHDRSAVREYWRQQRHPQQTPRPGGQESPCLVTGHAVGDIPLFPPICKVPGAAARAGLVSFNANAFESYGWSGNANAPVTRDAAEACATALNRLLDPAYRNPREPESPLPRWHIRLSRDTAVCFWARGQPGRDLSNVFVALLEGRDPAQVGDMYRSLWRGRPVPIDDPSSFYAVTVSGAKGRVIIRDWIETSVRDVAANLTMYFRDFQIVRLGGGDGEDPIEVAQQPRLQDLQDAVIRDKSDTSSSFRNLWARIAFQNAAIPTDMARRALAITTRLFRRDSRKTRNLPPAAGLMILKAWLRRGGAMPKDPHMDTFLNKMHSEPAYHCGRLLAVIAAAQTRSQKEVVKASVIRRNLGGFMTAPALHLGRLLRYTEVAYLPRIEGNRGRMLRDELKAIAARIGDAVPVALDLRGQSYFMLGFYHEYAHLEAHTADKYKYQTLRGEWVQSLGEKAIANALHQSGIGYVYEARTLLANGSYRCPDFLIAGSRPEDDVYVEFRGRCDDPTYMARWEAKVSDYRSIGILPAEEGRGPKGRFYTIDELEDTAALIRRLRSWLGADPEDGSSN